MTFTESIRIALRALLSNKLRAILTMLGIIIGVAAVITLMSVGKGVEQFVTESFQGLGSNLLFIFPGSLEGTSTTKRPEMTIGDYEAIADPFLVPDALAVAPELSSRADVFAGKRDLRTDIAGVTPDYGGLRSLEIAEGSFVSEGDVNARSRVAVLGSRAYEKLFEEGVYAIGQTIKINRIPFRVIGILEEKGGSAFGSEDNTIYVPLTTAHSRLYPWWRNRRGEPLLSAVYVQVADESLMDQAADQISERHVRHLAAGRRDLVADNVLSQLLRTFLHAADDRRLGIQAGHRIQGLSPGLGLGHLAYGLSGPVLDNLLGQRHHGLTGWRLGQKPGTDIANGLDPGGDRGIQFGHALHELGVVSVAHLITQPGVFLVSVGEF